MRTDLVRGTDIMIVRELLGGLYFGAPRSITGEPGGRVATNTMTYDEPAIERIARVAFDLAVKRRKKVLSVDKANAVSYTHLVEFSPEDATRTDPEFLCQVLDAVVEAGATTLNIPDTVGYTVPAEFGDLIATIRRRVKGIENVTISAHCHNDLGMAVANTMAAVAAGARQVECTICLLYTSRCV